MSPDAGTPLYQKRWRDLVAREKVQMRKYMKVLSELRQYPELSLNEVAKNYKVAPEDVVRNTNALRKEKGRWTVNPTDNLSRHWEFYEDGEAISIYVNNYPDTHLIAQYHNAVKKFLHTGDATYLKPFEGLQVRDEDGVYHTFETDPDEVRGILATIEDFETYEIYNV